jgi:uncharacterized protein YndB with AHSA1/START domain
MGTFQLEVTIDRPRDDVFAVIADPTAMPLWYEAVEHVTKTSAGPAATGATYEVTRSLPGGRAHNTVEITEHEAHHRVTLESRDGPTPFRYRYTLQLRPGGATSIMLDGRISGAGLPGPIAHLDPLTTQLFKHGMRRNLAELKRVIESTTASAATSQPQTSPRTARSDQNH